MTLSCSSRIDEVVVYARGALVVRHVDVAALPDGQVELDIPDLTPLVDTGQVRAELDAPGRRIVALSTPLVFPAASTAPGPSAATLDRLARELEADRRMLAALEAERARLAAIRPAPRLSLSVDGVAADARVADALAAARALSDCDAALDTRINAAVEAVRQAERAHETALLADRQARTAERRSPAHPVRHVRLQLDGNGPVTSLRVSYVVPAARWWPVYTLRIIAGDGGAKRAAWWLEAFVAQRSGEDWSSARVSLSTADLITDARLPELPALRLGRAQAAPRRGYRPPPAGLDSLFAGYAAAFDAPLPPPRVRPVAAAPPRAAPSPMATAPASVAAPSMMLDAGPPPGAPAAKSMSRARGGARAAPAAQAMPMAVPADGLVLGGAPPSPPMGESAPDSDAAPSAEWLDFDGLMLADNTDRGRRGRLVPAAVRDGAAAAARAEMEAIAAPQHCVDPLAARGSFDHIWRAAGRCDVPSDSALHRVRVADAEAALRIVHRTAPREAAEVFREAVLPNPFDGPLLAGPVDVYIDNSLLTTTPLAHVDRGAEVRLGLGVEDRLKVARRAQHRESSAGLLGGSLVTETDVRIELRSSLSEAAAVEVLDRWPVSDDDDLEIVLVAQTPKSRAWDQAERGAPIRHGLAFAVEVPPGGKSEVAFTYRLQHSAKSEIVGGSRRD